MLTLAVTLSPESISDIIVPAVPFGPNPCLMNKESISGTEMLALKLASVVAGLGVMSCEFLYLLYRLELFVIIACMEVMSQPSFPAKQVCIQVTASVRRLVILSTLSFRLLNPAHFSSPQMALSKARQMLQSVISRFCLSSGTQENDIIVIISVPLAQTSRMTIITRIQTFEQGLLSVSLRMESQGGQLRSKRQQSTVTMQKVKKMVAKMMQGDIMLFMQELSASISPFTTISSTWLRSLCEVKLAQMSAPMVATVVSVVVLYLSISNCAGQLVMVTSVQALTMVRMTTKIHADLQPILFYYLFVSADLIHNSNHHARRQSRKC